MKKSASVLALAMAAALCAPAFASYTNTDGAAPPEQVAKKGKAKKAKAPKAAKA